MGLSWLSSRLSRHWETRDLSAALSPLADESHREQMSAALTALAGARDLELTVYGDDRQVFASTISPPLSLPHFGERPPPPPPDDRGPPPDLADERPGPDRGPPRGEGFSPAPPPVHRPPPGRPDLREPPPQAASDPPPVLGGPPPAPPDQYTPLEHGQRIFLLVVHFVRGSRFVWGELAVFLAGLLVVGAGAFGTVRWIGRPIERLTRVARALGEGDLRVRADLARGDELGELGAAFDEMAGRMQRLLTAERELLANVSHELRTPLARIKVALDLAVEGDAAAARMALREIAVDLAELERLVDDVLQATRFALEDGRAPSSSFALRISETTGRELARTSAQRFTAHHPARELIVRLPANAVAISDGLEVDPQLVRRVLGNLLENAHKYSPDETTPIELVVEAPPGQVTFAVIDRGIGIPTTELPRVFDPFYRSERSRARGTGGVGLGSLSPSASSKRTAAPSPSAAGPPEEHAST